MTAGNKEPCGGLAPRCCPTDFLDAHTCLKFRNSTSIRVGTLGDREEAISFGSQRITTRRLCVSDDSGAQTCITKEQLDALLKRIPQADLGQPTVSVTVADPAPAAEPTETTAATNEIPSAPTAVPKKASDDTSEPATTGSLNVEPDGAALVWYPDVEISIAAAAQSEE